jgi:hypothetical protein
MTLGLNGKNVKEQETLEYLSNAQSLSVCGVSPGNKDETSFYLRKTRMRDLLAEIINTDEL